MTILPMVVSLAAQILITIAVMVVIAVTASFRWMKMGTLDQGLLMQEVSEITMNSLPVILLLYHVLATIGFGIWYYFGCGRPKPKSPRRVFAGRALPMTLLIGILMCVSATAYLSAAQYVMPEMIEQYEEMMEMAGLGTDPLTIFVSVIIAPVGEELLCRGLTFHYAKKVVQGMRNRRAAFWIANALQALMFGVMHGNLVQGSYAFALGLGLGWLRFRYDSLYPSMLAHLVVNLSSTVFMGYLFSVIPESLLGYVLLMAAGLAAILLLMRWDRGTVEWREIGGNRGQ